MTNPLFPRPIAHRGLHDREKGVIENSRSAFEAAIARGFGIECDLQLTGDGEAVVFHDDDTERLLGRPGRVRTYAADTFTAIPLLGTATGDTPQRFAHFLAQIDGRALLQVELKKQSDAEGTDTLARRAAEALRAYSGPVTVESFDPKLLVAIRRHGYAGPLGIITYGYDNEWTRSIAPFDRFVLRHLLHWPWSRFTFISCYQNSLELPAVRLCRALGMPVTAWTIRAVDEARASRLHADQIVFEGFDPDT